MEIRQITIGVVGSPESFAAAVIYHQRDAGSELADGTVVEHDIYTYQIHDTSVDESLRGQGLGGAMTGAIAGGLADIGVEGVPIHVNTNPDYWDAMREKYPVIGKVYKGEAEGHEFHGNQWTGGEGGGVTAPHDAEAEFQAIAPALDRITAALNGPGEESGSFLQWTARGAFGPGSLRAMTPSTADGLASVTETLHERAPGLMVSVTGYVTQVSDYKSESGEPDFAHVTEGHNAIILNAETVGAVDFSSLEEKLNENSASNWTAAPGLEGVIAHEAAHCLAGDAPDIVDAVMKAAGDSAPSLYGMTGGSAELFAEWVSAAVSSNPGGMADPDTLQAVRDALKAEHVMKRRHTDGDFSACAGLFPAPSWVKDRTEPGARTQKGLLAKIWRLLKGDVEGHEFHGNQWTSGEGGGDHSAPLSKDDAEYWLSGQGLEDGYLRDTMDAAVAAATDVAPKLYRGMGSLDSSADTVLHALQPGQTIAFGSSSFSTDGYIAESFAGEGGYEDAMGYTSVMMVLEPGAVGVDMLPYAKAYDGGAFADQKEWVTGGTFEVTKTWTGSLGETYIGLRQINHDPTEAVSPWAA